jgi:diguanylate cyclase (GGDEF)-like protein
MARAATISDIISLCLDIDAEAARLYAHFSTRSPDEETRSFWDDLSSEENTHVEFWKELHECAENGEIPQLFDDSAGIHGQLTESLLKARNLSQAYDQDPGVHTAFLIAFRMEFYLLHSCFADLFLYGSAMSRHGSLVDAYDGHIRKFVSALQRFGAESPDLELLGETVTSLWSRNRRLAHLSTVDELTGVLNRRGFLHAVMPLAHMAQRTDRNVGIVMADIDDFKKLNDTHGHPAGDHVLQAVGKVLRESIRASDVAGRYGGEEFVVFFSGIKMNEIARMAEKIRTAIAESTASIAPVTISMGIAETVPGGDVAEKVLSLIRTADDQLYRAKRRGKNRIVINDA